MLYSYSKRFAKIVTELKESWNKNSEKFWPYAGAKEIRNIDHFKNIFDII